MPLVYIEWREKKKAVGNWKTKGMEQPESPDLAVLAEHQKWEMAGFVLNC